MSITRRAVFAGQFYPGNPERCRRMIDEFLCGFAPVPGDGAITPHAGWMYSGSTAALAIASLAATEPEVVVIFGATHGRDSNAASVFPGGSWETPFGPLPVDERLADELSRGPMMCASADPHMHEHAIEVQLPILRHLLPDARIVPIAVQPGPGSVGVGEFCAAAVLESPTRVAFLGSTDLTHYGPAFGFEPSGSGLAGVRWAKDVNDRRIVALIQAMDAEGIVPEAAVHRNACGAGAIAATVAAMRRIGGRRYHELKHTCSAEMNVGGDPDPVNSVGYESGVFVKVK